MSFKDQFATLERNKLHETENLIQRKFQHSPHYGSKLQCIREDSETGRYYVVPGGQRYPSVTTLLSKTKSAESLRILGNWQKRLGIEKADAVRDNSARLGTALHNACEAYVDNRGDKAFLELPLFKQILPVFKKIGTVHLSESYVYSHKLKLAGTLDLVADFEGKLSLIDFKNSLRYKEESWIEDYFVQTSAYAIMVGELYNLKIEQIVIIMAVNGKEQPQVFVKKAIDCKYYVNLLNAKLKQFYGNTQ